MRVLDRWILGACDRLDALPAWRAIACLWAACFGANLAIGFGIVLPLVAAGADLGLPTMRGLLSRGLVFALVAIVLVGPWVETWIGQFLGFWVARHFTARPAPVILGTGIAFAAAHGLNAVAHGITQLGSGLVLAFTYFWASRRPPSPRPVTFTFAVHALNNLAAIGLAMTLGGLTPR